MSATSHWMPMALWPAATSASASVPEQQVGGVTEDIQANAPGGLVAKAVEHLHGLADLVDGAADQRVQFFAGSGERDAAGGAIEQAYAESGFQALDGVTQGRGTDADF